MNIALAYATFEQHNTGWQLRAVGAGSIPPLVRRASGETHWLETAGFPLGAVAVQRYDEVQVELGPGDVVLLLSDGVVEAMSAERELFGFDRLVETVAGLPIDTDAHTLQARVLEAGRATATAANTTTISRWWWSACWPARTAARKLAFDTRLYSARSRDAALHRASRFRCVAVRHNNFKKGQMMNRSTLLPAREAIRPFGHILPLLLVIAILAAVVACAGTRSFVPGRRGVFRGFDGSRRVSRICRARRVWGRVSRV